MMCTAHFSTSEIMEVLEIHRYPQFMDKCCDLINMEWPRSKTVRLRTLKMSCDRFPTCLVLVESCEVIGHSKITPVPSLPFGCFIESVLIHPKYRGKGLGKFLMAKTEDYAKRRGIKTVYLSTKDKQGFYSKLGYTECEPVQIYGGPVLSRQNCKFVPSNKTNTNSNINIPVQSTAVTASSATSIPKPVPLTPVLPLLPPPPPPPPPPTPNPNSSTPVPRSASTYMKKDI